MADFFPRAQDALNRLAQRTIHRLPFAERWVMPVGRTLKGARRRLARLYGLVGIALIISLFLFSLGLWGFIRITEPVLEGETQQFDEAVLRYLDAHATPRLDRVAVEVTALGSGLVVTVIVLALTGVLWQTRRRWYVLLLWLTMLGSALLNTILKWSFDRPRPQVFEWRVHYPVTPSFPSGHAMTAAVVYLTVAIIIFTINGSRKVGLLALLCAGLIMLLVGLSRLYVGVHYPSDVIAGYAAGIAWTGLCTLAVQIMRKRSENGITENG